MSETYLSVDFETRSTVNLPKTGVYKYAEDPSTSIICMAWAIGDGPVLVWRPEEPFPAKVVEWVCEQKPLRAHNAQFERVMWRDCLVKQVQESTDRLIPSPTLDQWHCTAAEAAAMALPRHLKKVSRVLDVDEKKDEDGRRLMLMMCKPRAIEDDGSIRWWDEEDPEKLSDLIDYCMQDVRAERAVAKRLRRLSPKERRIYLLDQKINDRGVKLDVPLIQAAQEVVNEELSKANEELAEITDGEVTKVTQVQRLNGWLNDSGLAIPNLQKATIRDFLEDEEFPDQETRRALEIRQEAGKTSTRKIKAMLRCRCEDDRARGLLLYHGASTGRWSGKLIQPQNFPRPSVKDVEDYIKPVKLGLPWPENCPPRMEVISSMLRSMLTASEGNRLLAGDFSQIEARVLGWLAGEPFEDHAYEKMAGKIYGVPWEDIGPDSLARQVGKVAELACGFGMGSDRYQETVKEWTGIEIDEETAEAAVETYREEKKGVVNLWYELESAAMNAVLHPGEVFPAGVDGNIKYTYRGEFLWCVLPSGRPLAYALPQVEQKPTPWGEMKPTVTYCGINGYTRKWERMSTYGGHLCENVVQATARDVMAESMLALEDEGYEMVMTVHDEVVADVPEGYGSLEEYLGVMTREPEWADGLEIEVEGYESRRYRK